jgi:hypothetical protein
MMLFALALFLTSPCRAFERDVHFGMTKWLAVQAGFSEDQADAIATGDQRIDAGDIQFMEQLSVYACTGKDAESSANVRTHSYPASGPLPGAPESRAVVAGSDAAFALSRQILKVDPGQAGFSLYKLGEALHALQDSWSHQGTPGVPSIAGMPCDAGLSWGHPASRGGWNSHRADITSAWPADTVAMAAATYKILTSYPAIDGVKRKPAVWDTLQPMLDALVSAKTKADKARWFGAHSIGNVAFLAGISLPDGASAFKLEWKGDKLPTLKSAQSSQHHIDADLLEFFNGFFDAWVATDDFAATATRFGLPATGGGAARRGSASSAAQLTARLKLWRMRDHGSVAELAHSPAALSAAQLSRVDALTRSRDVYARYAATQDAFTPILPKTPEPTPIVPFLVIPLPASADQPPRALATVRFRSAPYDTLQVLAAKVAGRWGVASISPIVEH